MLKVMLCVCFFWGGGHEFEIINLSGCSFE